MKQVFEHRFIFYTWKNDENLKELLINLMFQVSFKNKPQILFRKHLHFTCTTIIYNSFNREHCENYSGFSNISSSRKTSDL